MDPKEISRGRDHRDPDSPRAVGTSVGPWDSLDSGRWRNKPQLPGPLRPVRTHPDPRFHAIHPTLRRLRPDDPGGTPICVSLTPAATHGSPPAHLLRRQVPRAQAPHRNKPRNSSRVLPGWRLAGWWWAVGRLPGSQPSLRVPSGFAEVRGPRDPACHTGEASRVWARGMDGV